MKQAGTHVGAVWLRDVLRQVGSRRPQALLDELGDSLLARAMHPASAQRGGEAYAAANEALFALTQVGSRGPWGGGQPYAGASDRLITMHRTAPSLFIRKKSLGALLATPDHARAVDYLTQVAESSDSTAYDAIYFLVGDANGGSWTATTPSASEQRESGAALRALGARGRVTDGRAATMLEMWISRNSPAPPLDSRQ